VAVQVQAPEPVSGEPGIDDVTAAFSAIAEALSAETDLDGLLHLIAARVCQVAGVRSCTVYLRDKDQGLFRGQVVHNPARSDADAWTKRSVAGVEADRFTQEILATKEPVLIVNAREDPRPVRKAMLEWDIRSMLGVPMVLRDEVIGLLFLDNHDVPHVYTAEQQRLAAALANLGAVAISQARRVAELRETMQTVVRQNRLLRQVSAMDEQLTQQVLDGASVEDIAESVVKTTSNPCAIYDGEFRPLALHLCPGGPAPMLMEPAVRTSPEVSSALVQLKPGQPKIIGPLPALGLHRRHLVARVQGRGDVSGFVVLTHHGRPLTAFDGMVARRAATMVALELSAARRAVNADAHARQSLVRDLLHGFDEQRSLGRRASMHRLALDQPHVVCVVARRADADGRSPVVADVEAAVEAAGGAERPFCAASENGVAMLLRIPGGGSVRAGLASAKRLAESVVSSLAPDGSIVAGVSSVCRGVPDYPRALGECDQVIQCMTTLLADQSVRVLATDDLGAGRLLLSSTTLDAAERFATDVAGALLEDSQDRMHLLGTLASFFDANRNVRATGVALGVHENTVRYRLGKIAELTGLDLVGSAEDQLTAQFAMLVFKLRGWLGAWRTSDGRTEPLLDAPKPVVLDAPSAAAIQAAVG
jgi:sugar diacid utilization regulator